MIWLTMAGDAYDRSTTDSPCQRLQVLWPPELEGVD